jgi:hypothetical protein
MEWIYCNETFTLVGNNGLVGFVYLIRNVQSGKGYIGKKLFWFKKTKQIKGKKKKFLVESDWKTYYSSSEELKADVAKLGKENFHREILHLCTSKGNCNYLELREQIDRRVLESDDWYNSYVGSRIHKKHVRL